jgi:hypothetical protein
LVFGRLRRLEPGSMPAASTIFSASSEGCEPSLRSAHIGPKSLMQRSRPGRLGFGSR